MSGEEIPTVQYHKIEKTANNTNASSVLIPKRINKYLLLKLALNLTPIKSIELKRLSLSICKLSNNSVFNNELDVSIFSAVKEFNTCNYFFYYVATKNVLV